MHHSFEASHATYSLGLASKASHPADRASVAVFWPHPDPRCLGV